MDALLPVRQNGAIFHHGTVENVWCFFARIGKFLAWTIYGFFSRIGQFLARIGQGSMGVIKVLSLFVGMPHAACRFRTVIPLFQTEVEPSGQHFL